MMDNAVLILIAIMALGVILARHWPRPMLVDPPKHPCGFMPS